MLNLTKDLCDMLQARASSGGDADEVADTILIKIIRTLRHDPRFAEITRVEFELLLAGPYRELCDLLFHEMNNRIHLDEAEDAVCCCLGEEP